MREVARPDKSQCNAHARNVTRPPCVSNGSGSTNVFTDRYPDLASELVTKHDGGCVVVTKFRNALGPCLLREVTMGA